MRLTNNIYDNFKLVVDTLGTPDGVFYVGDGTTVTGAWAVFLAGDTIVVSGGVGASIGATEATLTTDYPAAEKLTTGLSVALS